MQNKSLFFTIFKKSLYLGAVLVFCLIVRAPFVSQQKVYAAVGPPSTTSTPPLNLNAIRGNAQVSLSWQTPADNGNTAIFDYFYEYKQSVTSSWSSFSHSATTSTSVIISPLTNGTGYDFRVSAINAKGTSFPSNLVSSTPAGPPTSPNNLIVAAGNTQATLSWQAPTDNGGFPVTDYSYEYKPSASSTWSSFSHSATTTTFVMITPLLNGISYDFRVSAINSQGASAPTGIVSAVPSTLPDPPVGVSAAAGDTVAVVSFTAASDGGSPITGFTVTSDQGGFTATGSSSPLTVTGLKDGISYVFTVTATNINGVSASSAPSPSVIPIANVSGGSVSFSASAPAAENNSSAPSSSAAGSGQTTSFSGTSPVISHASDSQIRLVNDQGTLYLIADGQKQGVTSPGILYSYGLNFGNATPASSQDLSLPQSGLLLPGDGSLVKSKEDPTVYLISDSQKYGFTSAQVFFGSGFNFKPVLTVTDGELQALPKAGDLSDPVVAHLPGVDIKIGNAVYWIGTDGKRHLYPNMAIYNSWHQNSASSLILTANQADLALPAGDDCPMRLLK